MSVIELFNMHLQFLKWMFEEMNEWLYSNTVKNYTNEKLFTENEISFNLSKFTRALGKC